MRSAITLLFLSNIIFPQNQLTLRESHKTADAVSARVNSVDATVTQEFNFPGSVALRLETDSMTDKQSCVASVASDLVGIDVAGDEAALLQTPSDIDYDQPAFLRIDEARPIALNIQRQKHHLLLRGSGTRSILIPLQRTPEFVNALYTRRRVRLRYSVFPGPGRFDGEIKFGDFASAYDRGVEVCGWRKLAAAPVHPSTEEVAALTFPGTDPAQPVAQVDPLGFYTDAVARLVTARWIAVRGSAAGTASVAIDVDKTGAIGSLPPSYTDLDRACSDAIRASNPLPPLPNDYEGRLRLNVECSGNAATVARLD